MEVNGIKLAIYKVLATVSKNLLRVLLKRSTIVLKGSTVCVLLLKKPV